MVLGAILCKVGLELRLGVGAPASSPPDERKEVGAVKEGELYSRASVHTLDTNRGSKEVRGQRDGVCCHDPEE